MRLASSVQEDALATPQAPRSVRTRPGGIVRWPGTTVIENKHSNRGWSMTYLQRECSCRRAEEEEEEEEEEERRRRFNVGRVLVLNNPPAGEQRHVRGYDHLAD